jgi:prostaglandin-endoperoxide synthase 2
MPDNRDTSRDGRRNNLESFALTHFKPLWRLLQSRPGIKRKVNKKLINNAILKIPTRPYAFSTKTPYVTWDSLIDRSFTGLHLPPRTWKPLTGDPHLGLSLRSTTGFEKNLPALEDVEQIYHMNNGTEYSPKSNLIFPYFVQWFTDGFLRTDRQDHLRNTSNHHIDFCTVYGLNPQITTQLRSHEGGRLKSQQINGEEYPQFYYDSSGKAKPEFSAIPHLAGHELPVDKRSGLFAMGVEVERCNVQPGYVMLNVLCLREHNRLAGLLAAKYSGWDDERLFQTARNILIVEVMKIVIDDYINHITPYHFKFITDPPAFTDEKWYRLNWISVEFSLVYRWHSMLPDTLMHRGKRIPMESTLWKNDMITAHGLGALFEESCTQPAAQLGLFNTPEFMVPIEMASVKLGRSAKLRGYNDYRELQADQRRRAGELCAREPVRARRQHRVVRRPLRRGPAAQLGPAAAGRPPRRHRCVLPGAHLSAAGREHLQPGDVLARRVGRDHELAHAVGSAAPQRAGRQDLQRRLLSIRLEAGVMAAGRRRGAGPRVRR